MQRYDIIMRKILAYDLKKVVKSAGYVRTVGDIKNNVTVKQFHYLSIKLKQEESFMVVKEMKHPWQGFCHPRE